MSRRLVWWTCWCLWLGGFQVAQASDRRVALLVGNQRGWGEEELLRHTITGDLLPLQKALRAVGFRVVLLANKGPAAVRAAFARLSGQKIDTFLFYYSGHAGPKAFHMGRRGKGQRPLGYEEFRELFGKKISSARRIAMIDACFGSRLMRLFKKSLVRTKGPRRRVRRNLIQALQPALGKTQGVQVIVSSQIYAFEDQKRKASIFTHYVLQGISGRKAADADQDGLITVAEIFRYAGKRFRQETGEEPTFFEHSLRGITPYALVPAYNSYLYVDAQVAGELSVLVGNFLWTQVKRKGSPYRLHVVAGDGLVRLRRGKTCFVQRVSLPKHGELRLKRRWKATPCHASVTRKKGLRLQARALKVRPKQSWQLALTPGYSALRSGQRQTHLFALALGLRWGDRVGLGLQWFHGTAHNLVATEGSGLQVTQLMLSAQVGGSLMLGRDWRLWLGGYAQGGLLWQMASSAFSLVFALGGGAQGELHWRLHPVFGLQLSSRMGVLWHPVTQGNGVAFLFQLTSGATFFF